MAPGFTAIEIGARTRRIAGRALASASPRHNRVATLKSLHLKNWGAVRWHIIWLTPPSRGRNAQSERRCSGEEKIGLRQALSLEEPAICVPSDQIVETATHSWKIFSEVGKP
jgi:hypothetical protein